MISRERISLSIRAVLDPIPPGVWALTISALVGAVSAVFAVSVYREAVVDNDPPIPVPSRSDGGDS